MLRYSMFSVLIILSGLLPTLQNNRLLRLRQPGFGLPLRRSGRPTERRAGERKVDLP